MSSYLETLNFTMPSVRTEPSPRAYWRPSVESTLRDSRPVEGFADHLTRDTPSQMPGVDSDVAFATEKLARGIKPVVASPVSGKLISSGGKYGSVRIMDKNGYEHRLLHMHLTYEQPIGGDAFPLMRTVEKGQAIGILGNVHPLRRINDHLHYSIIDTNGQPIDPNSTWVDREGAVVRVDEFEYDQMLIDRLGSDASQDHTDDHAGFSRRLP